MSDFPEINSWLSVTVVTDLEQKYMHALGRENRRAVGKILQKLRRVVARAHEDARQRLRRLAEGTLDPLGMPATTDLGQGYPEKLHLQTLKGYFGEVFAGLVAENLGPFGRDDWEVPAYLFRFHTVAFQQLGMMRQTGMAARMIPGRTGDDCLAFRMNSDGEVIAALFCEAKCTADHDTGLITEAHEKSSEANLVPVDILQVIEVLDDSKNPGAERWADALRRLNWKGVSGSSTFERMDQVTYLCGRAPRRGKKSWIPSDKPHKKYTGGRKLHVAEIHLVDVEALVKRVYGVK